MCFTTHEKGGTTEREKKKHLPMMMSLENMGSKKIGMGLEGGVEEIYEKNQGWGKNNLEYQSRNRGGNGKTYSENFKKT